MDGTPHIKTHCIEAAWLLPSAAAPALANRRIAVADGYITAVEELRPGAGRVLALPALVNAHDHARPVRSSSFGAAGKPLEIWLHYLALLPSVDPYLASAVSLARSALGGAGVVMVHYTRVQGLTDLPTEATEVARAARDVGVRVGFAVGMRDRSSLVYGPSEPILAQLSQSVRENIAHRLARKPIPPADQIAMVDAVAASAASATFDVQYGPQGVQWCTRELLERVAEASQRTGRRVHMHLLETRYQRQWADAEYPEGIVCYLDQLGLLSTRLTLAHCTWARPEELELIAERGATIAVNTSSNLGLRSGIAPLPEMIRRGCRVALGLDGLALDEDDDALREMRLAHLLHAGNGFRIDVDRCALMDMARVNGRRSVLNTDDGGALAPGRQADILMLDWENVDDDRLRPAIDPLDLLFARATAHHIRELVVAGRSIVRDGDVLGIDLAAMRKDLMARLRSGLAQTETFAVSLDELERAIKSHVESEPPCC